MNIQNSIKNKIKDRKTEVLAFRATKTIARKKAGAEERRAYVKERVKVGKAKGKAKARRGSLLDQVVNYSKSSSKKKKKGIKLKGGTGRVNSGVFKGDIPYWLK